jgi:hypothetical protein
VGEAAKAPEAGALDKKKDNFLPSRLGPGIVFQKADKPTGISNGLRASASTQGLGAKIEE